jgi:hypothetical protein
MRTDGDDQSCRRGAHGGIQQRPEPGQQHYAQIRSRPPLPSPQEAEGRAKVLPSLDSRPDAHHTYRIMFLTPESTRKVT